MISHRRIGSVSSGAVAFACLVSVGLNAFLATLILRPHPATTLDAPSNPAGRKSEQLTPGSSLALGRAEVKTTNGNAPFQWSQIESGDYRQYIANLRAVGCPEEIIRDIIMADLNQAYAARARAIWKPKRREYWQKRRNEEPGPEQQKKLEELSHEKAEICKQLFGVRLHDQKLIDTIFLQTHGSESELAFLPEDRKEAALAALADSGFDEKELRLRENGDYWNQRDELFGEKLKLLSAALSPSELDEFNALNSEVANRLRGELRYFELTPEEFKALLTSRERDGQLTQSRGLLNQATSEIRALFGEQRADEFERVTDMFYISARKAVEDQGLEANRAEQAWQATRQARAEAEQVAADVGLTLEEQESRVRSITSLAEDRLKQVLGEKASEPLRVDLRTRLGAVLGRAKK